MELVSRFLIDDLLFRGHACHKGQSGESPIEPKNNQPKNTSKFLKAGDSKPNLVVELFKSATAKSKERG